MKREAVLKLISQNNLIPRNWVDDIKNNKIPTDIRLLKYNDAYAELIDIMDEAAPFTCSGGSYHPSLFIKGFNNEEITSWTTFINKVLAYSEYEITYDKNDTLDIISGALVFGLPIPQKPIDINSEEEMVKIYNCNDGESKLYQVIINYIQNYATDHFKILKPIFNEEPLSENEQGDACELTIYIYYPAIYFTHDAKTQVDNKELFEKTMAAHKVFINETLSNLKHLPIKTQNSLRDAFP